MSELAIEILGLRKTFRVGFSRFKVVEALRGVDLAVQAGEIYGFLGPNGAGKSTTMKIITRLIFPSAGEVRVFGQPVDHPTARRRIGFLPETPSFYDYLTGREFLSYYSRLLGLARAAARKQSAALLEQVGLGRSVDLQLRRYSKGMLQRVGIAQALLGDPDLIILDEPVSGLDPIGRKDVRELMLELRSKGKTVFFSTHIIPDVELVCDRVGIIISGRMVKEGTVAELLDAERKNTEVVFVGLTPEQAAGLGPDLTVREMAAGVGVSVPSDRPVEPIIQAGIEKGGRVEAVHTERRALEDIFVDEFGGAPSSEASAEEAA